MHSIFYSLLFVTCVLGNSLDNVTYADNAHIWDGASVLSDEQKQDLEKFIAERMSDTWDVNVIIGKDIKPSFWDYGHTTQRLSDYMFKKLNMGDRGVLLFIDVGIHEYAFSIDANLDQRETLIEKIKQVKMTNDLYTSVQSILYTISKWRPTTLFERGMDFLWTAIGFVITLTLFVALVAPACIGLFSCLVVCVELVILILSIIEGSVQYIWFSLLLCFVHTDNTIPGEPTDGTFDIEKANLVDVESCPICMEDLGDDAVTTRCGHSFCKSCLMTWEIRQGWLQCPSCRTDLKSIVSPRDRLESCLSDIPKRFILSAEQNPYRYRGGVFIRYFILDQIIGQIARDVSFT